jgi:O6-methylguanine-DNA--protein-cysteine methyltransferase
MAVAHLPIVIPRHRVSSLASGMTGDDDDVQI